MPGYQHIWVQYIESDLDYTFQGRIPSLYELYFGWTWLNQIVQLQVPLPARKPISTFSKKFKKTQQWILHAQVWAYAVVVSPKFKDLHSWADSVDGFIQVIKQTDMIHNVHVGSIVGLADSVQENAASDKIDSVWLVNNHVDFDIYWTVCWVTMPQSSCAGGRWLNELYYWI